MNVASNYNMQTIISKLSTVSVSAAHRLNFCASQAIIHSSSNSCFKFDSITVHDQTCESVKT